ncbi:MAG: choice-of-anchor P family protein [Tahibacter sp.]
MTSITKTFAVRPLSAALLFALSAAMPLAANAAPTGAAHAYDLSMNISVVGVGSLVVTPQAEVQHTPQIAAWSDADQVLSLDTGPGALRLTTGELNAVSQWIPGVTYHAVGSQASADNVNLSVLGLASANLLGLQAQRITATAIVAGSCPPPSGRPVAEVPALVEELVFASSFDNGGLRPRGNAETPGLTITALGTNIPGLPALPAPNTSVDLSGLGILGTTLILNEQVTGGDGVHNMTLSANGLHLTMNVAGVITANVIIAHADAAIACP